MGNWVFICGFKSKTLSGFGDGFFSERNFVTVKGRVERTLDKEEGQEHVMEEARELRRGARPKIPNSKLKDFY